MYYVLCIMYRTVGAYCLLLLLNGTLPASPEGQAGDRYLYWLLSAACRCRRLLAVRLPTGTGCLGITLKKIQGKPSLPALV